MTIIKTILIFTGTVSLCIGALGILIPGLPTTPFLLISANLYLRSSEKIYHTLITNKYIGSFVFRFRSDKGMTKGVKFYSICIMWMMITLSCMFLIIPLSVDLILLVLGIIGTIAMGFIVPTINNSKS